MPEERATLFAAQVFFVLSLQPTEEQLMFKQWCRWETISCNCATASAIRMESSAQARLLIQVPFTSMPHLLRSAMSPHAFKTPNSEAKMIAKVHCRILGTVLALCRMMIRQLHPSRAK